MAGKRVTVPEVVAEACKDEPFFVRSGGGVTGGGGEPLAQAEFPRGILMERRALRVHTAVETCRHVPWPAFETILLLTDLFLYDVKHLNADTHRAQTGGDVALILSNLERLAGSGGEVIVRVPVVPGFNDAPADIRAKAEHVARLGTRELHLSPYQRLGKGKYRLLGRTYRFSESAKVPDLSVGALRALTAAAGLRARVEGA